MKKSYLKSYKPCRFQALNNNGMTYELTIQDVFFGFIKRNRIITIDAPCDISPTKRKWDRLIASKKPLR